MPVPLLDVNAQNHPIRDELRAAFDRVLDKGAFILGDEVLRFENEAAAFLGVEHAIGVSSGTDAILLALMALGIGPGDEVICPSFTFFATAGCISRVGATPVFADSCPVCFNIDAASVRSKITDRTKAVIPVHLFGQSAEMDELVAIADEFGLRIVEDAAQAFGARYRGRQCGTIGDFGTYSFFPSKNLGGLGDGGLLATNDPGLAEKARILRNHGSEPKYHHHFVGGNFRLDALQAALLGVKLTHYATYTEKRRANAQAYREGLTGVSGVTVAREEECSCPAMQQISITENGAKIVLPVEYGHNEHIWNQFTLRLLGDGQRDRFRQHLSSVGIASEIYYPIALSDQKCFASLPGRSKDGTDLARILAREVVSIPIYPELSGGQVDEVISGITSFLDR